MLPLVQNLEKKKNAPRCTVKVQIPCFVQAFSKKMQFININAKKRNNPMQTLDEHLKAWLHNNNSASIQSLMYFYLLIQLLKLRKDERQRVMLNELGMLKGTVP